MPNDLAPFQHVQTFGEKKVSHQKRALFVPFFVSKMKRTLHYCDSLPTSTANTELFIHFCSRCSGWMFNAQTIEHLRG